MISKIEMLEKRGRVFRAPLVGGRTAVLGLMCCGWALIIGIAPIAQAQDEAESVTVGVPEFARRVRVTLPITGSADVVTKQAVGRILDQLPATAERPLIVFEFWAPAGSEGAGSEFERSLSLARYLTSPALRRVRTVAYIPRAVTGHAVLPVLACEQILMHPDAVLGDAGAGETSIGPTMRGGYTEISRSRRTVPEAIALGMLDAELEIDEVTTGSGVLYTWSEELPRLREERKDIRAIDTVIPAGRMGRFRGDELRERGFVSYLVRDEAELATVLKIRPDQLEFDPSSGGEWRSIRVELTGPVTASTVERVMRTIQQQRDINGINFVCLQIDSPGGSVVESVRLANFLADLDPSQIRTVAYVPQEARADAMVVAMACDHLVAHPKAVLGGGGAVRISSDDINNLREPLEQIARRKNCHWSLFMAMLDPDLVVYRYTQADTKREVFLCQEEFEAYLAPAALRADPEEPIVPADWTQGTAITTPGELLQVNGRQGESLQLTRFVVENFAQLQQLYQLPTAPDLIGPNWAFDLIDALASPQLAGILLFIGGFALISELSSPGLGIGGFLSAVCFMLYFWSNFLHGTAEVLEVMLFLTGVVCLAVEIFVIPGFGIFGLGGVMLVFASLVLASQTFVFPSNEYQMEQLSRSMLTVATAGFGVLASLYFLRKYMQHIPILGKIMLLPPSGDDLGALLQRETMVDYSHLIGKVGATRTPLTPSGKAVFGDEVVDVISDGEWVGKGSAVEVIEAQGNRVLVRLH